MNLSNWYRGGYHEWLRDKAKAAALHHLGHVWRTLSTLLLAPFCTFAFATAALNTVKHCETF
jgi:hypothetical protein